MRFGSVCSGIEAASVAWGHLGWQAAWLSEVDKFPGAVLAQRHPGVKNLGDMGGLPEQMRRGVIEAPDILVGGTPCQAFSVAGLRNSLDDARGQLTLTFIDLANAIDEKRNEYGLPETIICWENVPGVLSSKDNAFGCFLAGLAGEDEPLEPPGQKWSDAGCVFGPQRAVAWRCLDAQYFGLAQRRKRVFVIASAREGFDPTKVLFEFDGVRRDSPPRREAREEVAGALTSSLGRRNGLPDCGSPPGHLVAGALMARMGRGFNGQEAYENQLVAFGGNNTSGPIEISPALNACATASGRQDFESECFVVHGTQDPLVNDSLCFPLGRNNGAENAVFSIQAGATRVNPNSGPDGVGVQEGVAYTLEARAEVQAVCVTGQVTHSLTAEGFDASDDGPMGVRRLMPVECERLQGFPDNYTAIAGAADGPRYKALGNSMAVPVMLWLGARILGAV